MSRNRKLVIVSLVLTAGIALAWPFRKTPDLRSSPSPSGVDMLTTIARPPHTTTVAPSSPSRHVAAKVASTSDSSAPKSGFDLVHHPTRRETNPNSPLLPVTPSVPPPPEPSSDSLAGRPAYATIEQGLPEASHDDWPSEVMHVVQNSDTLEKLAARYLGDKSRALEIFQLNRDRLTNPHLLPIDAELRIPVAPDYQFD